jgi:hypothetical protein
MGRRDSDASPIIVDANGCAASSPASIRMVLPELPQSSGPAGAAKPAAPRPSMVTSGGSDGRADGVRVGAWRVVGNGGPAVGNGTEQGIAMRNGLVTRNAQHAGDRARRGNDHAIGHSHPIHYNNLTRSKSLWYLSWASIR